MTQVNMRHSRTTMQSEAMERSKKDRVCPFCHDFCGENTPIYHTKPILNKTAWWAVTENFEPYSGSKVHLLLIYRGGHVTMPSEIPTEGWADLGHIVEWAIREYKLPAGGFFFRFGDTDYTGATINHFHAQIIFGGEKYGERLRVKLGYTGMAK